jgi:EAL domain-containing protein (putative c-di-GMP-specific phosphodiesterase class I)
VRLRTVVETMLYDDGAVYSVYQRVVWLSDRVTVGWEGLARPRYWRAAADVEALFLTAQQMGAGRDLDWRCRRSALWNGARLDGPLFVNVNVSGLVDPLHGVDQMELVCRWAGRSPSAVVLELSERESMPDLRRLGEAMAEYRAAGFRFALDDIGEGHTTLELILAARPEYLKLAKPLIRAAGDDPAAYSAARAIVGFAHDIGSLVIAEGVEDEVVLGTCLRLDIDQGQGWLFGRPQAASDLRTW